MKHLKYFFLIAISIASSCNIEHNEIIDKEKTNAVSDSLISVQNNTKMVYIPGGVYKPFYGTDSASVKVEPFLIDERPVTNQEYLEFVIANPQWRKSNIKRIFADSSYLKSWTSDTTLSDSALANAPICEVSWFACKAFAKSVHKRMPTLDEWEFVAMADEVSPNARKKPQYSDAIIDLYLQKDRQFQAVKNTKPNYWGVYNMFDLIWEWTDDFNSVLTTGESRGGQYDDKGLFCAASATSATDVLNYAAFMRFALRGSIKANYTIANLGFRCAKDTTFTSPKP
ncbi:MAG TPA: formylglycine-generating enzyme family protein [Chitinophagaceae bacterium]|nr:formylglycine-generating enzyme family protein [Chitinophagaceae bacterium]